MANAVQLQPNKLLVAGSLSLALAGFAHRPQRITPPLYSATPPPSSLPPSSTQHTLLVLQSNQPGRLASLLPQPSDGAPRSRSSRRSACARAQRWKVRASSASARPPAPNLVLVLALPVRCTNSASASFETQFPDRGLWFRGCKAARRCGIFRFACPVMTDKRS